MPPSTELPQAAWSAEADVGAERRNPVPLSQKSRCLAGRRPADGTMGHIESDGGSESKRRGGCRVDSCGHAATGEPPGIDEASEPWRVALQAGPGAFTASGRADESQRWQARRAETVLAATVGRPARRSRRMGRQRKASQGTLAALAAAPPVSHSEAADRPSELSYPTPAPGLRDADPGRGRLHCARRGPAGGAGATGPDPLSGRVACRCGGAPPRGPPRGTAFRRR